MRSQGGPVSDQGGAARDTLVLLCFFVLACSFLHHSASDGPSFVRPVRAVCVSGDAGASFSLFFPPGLGSSVRCALASCAIPVSVHGWLECRRQRVPTLLLKSTLRFFSRWLPRFACRSLAVCLGARARACWKAVLFLPHAFRRFLPGVLQFGRGCDTGPMERSGAVETPTRDGSRSFTRLRTTACLFFPPSPVFPVWFCASGRGQERCVGAADR
jgi:hypothetical protein